MSELTNFGKGTIYEFTRYRIETPMPHENSSAKRLIHNEWFDKAGTYYKLLNNILFITANSYFPEYGFSVIDYINQLPKDFSVVLKIKAKPNEISGYNMLFNRLSVFPVNKNVFIDISDFSFSERVAFDVEKLPNNVKITSLLHDNKESSKFSNYSFESWALNCNNQDFELLITKLTPKTAQRISRLREIARNFYRFSPPNIRNGTNMEKINFAYKWCCEHIKYDYSAIKEDGSLKFDRRDAQDPIFTFDRRKGICEGRARLLKTFLNNHYMKVPCFLVKGFVRRKPITLSHTWNEAILDNCSIIDIDISRIEDRIATSHDELSYFDYDKNLKKSAEPR